MPTRDLPRLHYPRGQPRDTHGLLDTGFGHSLLMEYVLEKSAQYARVEAIRPTAEAVAWAHLVIGAAPRPGACWTLWAMERLWRQTSSACSAAKQALLRGLLGSV
jgi:hypothetical protein